jgi:hypothetical protein
MKKNRYSEIVLDEDDLCDLVMQGRDVTAIDGVIIDTSIDLEKLKSHLEDPGSLVTWGFSEESDISIHDFDRRKQNHWFMPDEYRNIDIAEHVLSLCSTPEQLQRAGQELLLFQERDMLDLLRYLRYLVAVMRDNNIIWGVGRGSSVASYVLYLLNVHRIDAMYYDLDPREFLR